MLTAILAFVLLASPLAGQQRTGTPPSDVFGQRRPLLQIDEAKLLAGGLQKITAKYITLYTD
ncbi:MAG: hypothetical protein WBH86_05495, partial [Thermogutta sp.]